MAGWSRKKRRGQRPAAEPRPEVINLKKEAPTGRAEVRAPVGYLFDFGFRAWKSQVGLFYRSNDGQPMPGMVIALLLELTGIVGIVGGVTLCIAETSNGGKFIATPVYICFALALAGMIGGLILALKEQAKPASPDILNAKIAAGTIEATIVPITDGIVITTAMESKTTHEVVEDQTVKMDANSATMPTVVNEPARDSKVITESNKKAPEAPVPDPQVPHTDQPS